MRVWDRPGVGGEEMALELVLREKGASAKPREDTTVRVEDRQ